MYWLEQGNARKQTKLFFPGVHGGDPSSRSILDVKDVAELWITPIPNFTMHMFWNVGYGREIDPPFFDILGGDVFEITFRRLFFR